MYELSKIEKEIKLYITSESTQKIKSLREEIEEKLEKILGGVFPNQENLWINEEINDRAGHISIEVKIKILIKVKKEDIEEVRKSINKLENEIMEKYS
ncbi:hypothetical protein [Acinetobacter sp. WCHAc060042]|uniref:hypothetical protein n=1 Tax=Acinetobacter sp. WCHAc060042 TaxID=2213016 RepID=UPI000DA6A7C6|nr:hypothetical protein [Acinetobacter sp. WCHAc060042]